MCQSLYQSTASMENATFYEHLLKLNHWDGLRLATAQMIISSSFANEYLAGGDILRMANNLIKFENLLTSPSIPHEERDNLHLLTISMDDYITSPKNTTMKFLDFMLGCDDTIVSRRLRTKAAEGERRRTAEERTAAAATAEDKRGSTSSISSSGSSSSSPYCHLHNLYSRLPNIRDTVSAPDSICDSRQG